MNPLVDSAVGTLRYDIPGLGKMLGVKALGALTDHWQLSGVISSISGAPFNPSCGLTSDAASVTGGYTGTPDVSARCNVIGDPLANLPTSGFNSMVGPPVLGNQGGGAGALTRPRVTNFDATVTKNVPLGSEKRVLKLQVQAYQVSNAASLGYATGTLPARVLAFTVRLEF